MFDFQQCGKAVNRPKKSWEEGGHKKLTTINYEKHNKELQKHIKFNSRVIPEIKEQLSAIVNKYWDCFCKEGAKIIIMGYQFSINTGNANLV